ncbi:MAG: hypothetical protein ABI718_03885 [Acidobacteriota bacterium]
MKATPLLLLIILLALPALAGTEPTGKHAANDQYVIVLRDKAGAVNWNALGASVDFTKGNRLVVRIPAQALAGVSRNPNIKYILRMVPLEEAAAVHSSSGMAPEVPVSAAGTVSPMVASSPTTWSSGNYSYDGAGNVASIGTKRLRLRPAGKADPGQLSHSGRGNGHGELRVRRVREHDLAHGEPLVVRDDAGERGDEPHQRACPGRGVRRGGEPEELVGSAGPAV